MERSIEIPLISGCPNMSSLLWRPPATPVRRPFAAPHLDEISGVGFDQIGIELMLADQLAEAVANFGAVVVSVLAIDRLGWDLLRLPGGRGRSCNDPISSTEPVPLP